MKPLLRWTLFALTRGAAALRALRDEIAGWSLPAAPALVPIPIRADRHDGAPLRRDVRRLR